MEKQLLFLNNISEFWLYFNSKLLTVFQFKLFIKVRLTCKTSTETHEVKS